MHYLIVIFFMFSAATLCAAAETPSVAESLIVSDMAKDNEAPPTGTLTDKKETPASRYTVKEETDVVKRALDVFKKKSKKSSVYRKKFRLYDTYTPNNDSYVSFMTNDQNAGIVFSPDQEYVYYLEMTPDGRHRLSGVKVTTQEEFLIGPANDFYIETCPGTSRSYVIVNDGTKTIHVFDLDGRPATIPDMPADINDFQDVICH